MNRVVVPIHPGLFSAFGLLLADVTRTYEQTHFARVEESAVAGLIDVFERLERQAADEFAGYGYERASLRFDHVLGERDLADGGWLEQLIAINVRAPELVIGDLRAQVSANRTGERRFQELVARFSQERVLRACTELQDYSERMARAVLGSMPDGEYSAEDFVDDNGFTDDPLRV
ncbi:hydantoinase B/oxoprolinase family protein, partial [Streptomyces sp. NPDC002896]|uniref:hydantoinase B/oxoprolinase family protein n=1 Tax=Streptomyces sp. NPDC002896 TaxID=3154438 RepID=UPI00331C5113